MDERRTARPSRIIHILAATKKMQKRADEGKLVPGKGIRGKGRPDADEMPKGYGTKKIPDAKPSSTPLVASDIVFQQVSARYSRQGCDVPSTRSCQLNRFWGPSLFLVR